MRLKTTISLFFLTASVFFSVGVRSQINLVPNSSFEEDKLGKPTVKFNHNLKDAFLVKDWWQPTGGTTDYYNSDKSTGSYGCSVRKARTGEGRLGLVVDEIGGNDYKEYAQCHLKVTLQKDKLYSVNFFVVLDKRCPYTTSSIGAYLSADAVSNNNFFYTPILEKPQVVTTASNIISNNKQWSLVHGYYRAKGNEQYITIGSFGHNKPRKLSDFGVEYEYGQSAFIRSAYYYLDDVSVYEVSDTTKDEYKKLSTPSKIAQTYNNLALVLDVSQSMQKADKIKSLKHSVDSLISSLDTNETISVITFDASPKVLAKGIKASEKHLIISLIDSLKTGGGTNINAAIKKAYDIIDSTYAFNGNNRVVLITDAGFKVSPHCKDEIEKYSKDKQVGFSTLVFNDIKYRKLKRLCKHNNGIYANINSATFGDALQQQVVSRPVPDDYTHANMGLKAKGVLLKVAFVTALISLLLLSHT